MKKRILWSICFLLVTALIPLCAGTNGLRSTAVHSENINTSATKDETVPAENIELSNDEADLICCTAMEYITESTTEEAKLAILSLCANNYIYEKQKGTATEDFRISTYSDTELKKLRSILAKGLVEFQYQSQIVYIPIVRVSPGYTVTDDEYPYISAVASPWDKTAKNYSSCSIEKCGISIAGIEYLCSNSEDATQALMWYLPDFEIKYVSFQT